MAGFRFIETLMRHLLGGFYHASRAQWLERARKMLRRAATRAKRARTIETRWKRRVTALSRRIPTGRKHEGD